MCHRDCPKKGRFWAKLRKMHKQYGMLKSICSARYQLISIQVLSSELVFQNARTGVCAEMLANVIVAFSRSIHGRYVCLELLLLPTALSLTCNVSVQVHVDDPTFFDTFYTNSKLDKHQWFYRLFGDNLAAVSTPTWVSPGFSRYPTRLIRSE